jgi:general secretion pathway protein D
MNDSNTKIIQNPQMRVSDNQKATLKIGDRIPIATGSFSPGVGGAGVNVLVNTQFQYLDVGVSVDITPHIHSPREVTLKISMEISSVTGQQNIGGVTQPIIGQRRIEHETRLREGEVNLLGGFLEDSQTESISGYPWLTKIPLMRYLFGQSQTDHTQREIVFAITPHIVRAQEVRAENLRAIDVGTADSIELRYNSAPKSSAPATPALPPTPSDSRMQTPPESTTPQLTPPQPLPLGTPGTAEPRHPDTPTGQTPEPPPIPGSTPPQQVPSVPVTPMPAAPPIPGSTPQQQVPRQTPQSSTPQRAVPAGTPGTAEQQRQMDTPAAQAPAKAGNTTLNFQPANLSQPVGSTFKVYVSLDGARNIFSIPLEISYDPKHLQVVDVSSGGFLSQDRQTAAVFYRADTAKGELQITGTRPPKSGGISGSGTAFVITLSAKAAGESVMAITDPALLDSDGQAAPAIGGSALIKITGNEAPDDRMPVGKSDGETRRTDHERTVDLRNRSTPSSGVKVESSPASPSLLR